MHLFYFWNTVIVYPTFAIRDAAVKRIASPCASSSISPIHSTLLPYFKDQVNTDMLSASE